MAKTTKKTKRARKPVSNGEIKIEANVPLPPKRHTYPFGEMNVGDSFFAENANSVRQASARMSREIDKKFTCRAVEGGVRAWRIE